MGYAGGEGEWVIWEGRLSGLYGRGGVSGLYGRGG